MRFSRPLLVVLIVVGIGTNASGGLSAVSETTVPKVSITSPASGATVGGTFTVSGSASDNVQVSKVEVRVDSGAYRLASGTTSWSVSIVSTGYPSGSHTLTARVTDSSGNQAWAAAHRQLRR